MTEIKTPQFKDAAQITVSIVMPSLNQAAFIERSIRSILSQTEISEIEVIVMDGGSTDGTQDIIGRLSNEYSGHLLVQSEPDRGPSHAVNKAITIAQGEIIGWLNADDLYTPRSICRAVEAFEANPELMMVYGHGQHIDTNDQPLEPYPTRLPNVGLEAFADGCFICQPTAFLKKQVFNDLGLLDENLRTAFDFEYWLRIFKYCPDKIGFIEAIQAESRLHENCITLNQRSTVIQEGMQLLAKYLGAAPLHWFKTYVNDQLAGCPHDREIHETRNHLSDFAGSIREYLSTNDQQKLQQVFENDARIQLATSDVFLDVYPDGWLPDQCSLRISAQRKNLYCVELHGKHVSNTGRLKLLIRSSDGMAYEYIVNKSGLFSITIPLVAKTSNLANLNFTIESCDLFIPSEVQPESDDNRKLVCRIEGIRTHPSIQTWIFYEIREKIRMINFPWLKRVPSKTETRARA